MSMFLHHLMPASGVSSFRQSCLRCCPLPLSTSSINWSFKTSCVSQWTPKIGYYGEYENHEIWTKHIFHNVYLFPSKALSVISLCCLVLLLSAWVTSDSFSQDQQKKGGRGGELQLCDWQPQLWLFSCTERGGGGALHSFNIFEKILAQNYVLFGNAGTPCLPWCVLGEIVAAFPMVAHSYLCFIFTASFKQTEAKNGWIFPTLPTVTRIIFSFFHRRNESDTQLAWADCQIGEMF